MNLLPEDTQVSAEDLEGAADTIMRQANSGVRQALEGELNLCHITEGWLRGIWMCFPNHPLGYLAHRAQILITAAKYSREGQEYAINETELKLAGLTTGEAA